MSQSKKEVARAIAEDTARAKEYQDQAAAAQTADAEAARRAYEQRPAWQQLVAQVLKVLVDALPNHPETTITQMPRRRSPKLF